MKKNDWMSALLGNNLMVYWLIMFFVAVSLLWSAVAVYAACNATSNNNYCDDMTLVGNPPASHNRCSHRTTAWSTTQSKWICTATKDALGYSGKCSSAEECNNCKCTPGNMVGASCNCK